MSLECDAEGEYSPKDNASAPVFPVCLPRVKECTCLGDIARPQGLQIQRGLWSWLEGSCMISAQ